MAHLRLHRFHSDCCVLCKVFVSHHALFCCLFIYMEHRWHDPGIQLSTLYSVFSLLPQTKSLLMAFCRGSLHFTFSFVSEVSRCIKLAKRKECAHTCTIKTNHAISCTLAAKVVNSSQKSRGQNMKVLTQSWSWRRSDMGEIPRLSSAPSFVFHLFHPVQLSLRSLQQQTARPRASLLGSLYCCGATWINWNLNTCGFRDYTAVSSL